MEPSYSALLGDLSCAGGASRDAIEHLMAATGRQLPSDYCDFLQQCDGGEGFIGERYLVFWAAAELALFNREYQVDEYAPGLLLFAGDGGGEAFGFDYRSTPPSIVQVPLIGLSLDDALPLAPSFSAFMAALSPARA